MVSQLEHEYCCVKYCWSVYEQNSTKFLSNKDMKRKVCRRHFGIDACGIVELKQDPQYGLEFVFHTPKGHVGSMSGNGCICFVTYAKASGIHPQLNDVTFLAGDGIHSGNYNPRSS